MRTPKTSTDDVIGTAEALLNGAAGNAELVQKYCLDQKALADLLGNFLKVDARQEKAKADLHLATQELVNLRRQLKTEFGRWVSVLEGQLGKNNKKLQEFGIAPRNMRPHKGPRTPADGPVTPDMSPQVTPAPGPAQAA